MGDIKETGISWDHDTGRIVISTRRKAVVSKLKKLGLSPARGFEESPEGYTTFIADENKVRVGFRAPRKLTDAQRQEAAERMKSARKAT
jgi:hypothetical protein